MRKTEIIVVLLLLSIAVVPLSCERNTPKARKQVREVTLPDKLPDTINAENLKKSYNCIQAIPFEAEEQKYMVLVCQEAESDYLVGCFHKQATGYEHVGVDVHLLGFTKPSIPNPQDKKRLLVTTHMGSNEGFHLTVSPSGCDLQPDEGEWEEVPKRKANDGSV